MKPKEYHYIFLVVLLAFAFSSTYSPVHSDYPFPYHHDEWQHLGISMQAMEEGYNRVFNPFLGVSGWHTDLESGFHMFLSNFFLMTGADPVFNYQYLAAIFAVISGFIIFLCVFRLTDKFYAGIIALIVFISLKSNINILGKDYFIPMTMAIPLIFLFILYFLKSLREKNYKKFFISVILLGMIFLVHPPSAVILMIPAMIEILFNYDFIKRKYKKFRTLLIFVPAVVFLIVLLLWKGEIPATLGYLSDLLIFEQGWGKVEIAYFVPALYGWISTLFAVYGFIIANKLKLRFIMAFAFISLGMTAFFNIFSFSFLIPYSRAVHYSMLSLIPLTAIGVISAIYSLNKRFEFEKNSLMKITISLIFLFVVINSQYDLDMQYKEYSLLVIDEQDYSTLKWIENNYGSDNTLVTPYFMTSAVYPVTGNKVISLIPSQMGGGFIEQNSGFYTDSCDDKRTTILESGANVIFSNLPLECRFMREVYSGANFVYIVDSI